MADDVTRQIDPFWGTLAGAIGSAFGGTKKSPETRMEWWFQPEEAARLKSLLWETMGMGIPSEREQALQGTYLGALERILGQTGGLSDEEMRLAYEEGARPIQQRIAQQRQAQERELALMGSGAPESGYALEAANRLGAQETGELSSLSRQLALENALRRSQYGLEAARLGEQYFGRRGAERLGAMGTAGGFLETKKLDPTSGGWAGLRNEGWTWSPPETETSRYRALEETGAGGSFSRGWRPPLRQQRRQAAGTRYAYGRA